MSGRFNRSRNTSIVEVSDGTAEGLDDDGGWATGDVFEAVRVVHQFVLAVDEHLPDSRS